MARAVTASARLPVHGCGLVGTPWWGMLCLIATEGILFVYLIFSYAYLASQSRGAFVPGGAPALDLAIPATIALLTSSATAEWSKRSARAGNLDRSRLALGLTLLLGLTFVALSGIEWSRKPFVLSDLAYSSIYFLLTGTHLTHVALGLLALAALLIFSLGGKVAAGHDQHRTLITLYWHFVDAVWLFVFGDSVYLSATDMSDPAALEEKVGHPAPDRHKLAPWRQFLPLILPPLLFSAQIIVSFTAADSACTKGYPPALSLLIFNAVVLASLAGVLLLSWRNGRIVRDESGSGLKELHDRGDGRTAFLVQFGLSMSALFVVASLIELGAILFLGTCVGFAPSV